MKTKLFRITLFLLAAIILFSAFTVTAAALGALPEANSKKRHKVCGELSQQAEAYYTGDYSYDNLITLSGAEDTSTSYAATQNNELYSSLQTLMSVTHEYYSTYSGNSKGSLAYFWARTDAVEGSSTYVMFYSDIPADTSGVKLNREHIWPKSRASFGEKNGGADLNHLRPSVDKINSAKSDHLFGNVSGVYETGVTEVIYNNEVYAYVNKANDLFECKDDVKGDVARILLYVYCRWGQPNLYTDMTENLPEPESDSKSNSGKKVIESLDTLLSWCASDPVDEWEMERNDLVQDVQGNRNVFIDYPQLAWLMFGREIPEDMQTPDTGTVPSGEVRLRGDADKDGQITVTDATAVQRVLVCVYDVSMIDEEAADVTGDGLDITDATAIQRQTLMIDNPFRIGAPMDDPGG